MNQRYASAIKRRIIQKYLSDNNRSPSPEKLRELISAEIEIRPNLDIVGFSSLDITKPRMNTASSISTENLNRAAIQDDYSVIDQRINDLIETLEDCFRAGKNTINKTSKLISSIESRLNNLLLLKGKANVFAYGIEENFETQDLVDFKTTTGTVESRAVSLKRSSRTLIPLDSAKISFSSIGKAGIIGASSNSPISTLKSADGKFWEYQIITANKTGRVMCVIDLDLKEPAYISDVKVVGTSLSVNSKTHVSLFYSIDGKSFAASSKESLLITGDNIFGIGVQDIKRLRIIFSKDVSDDIDGNSFIYLFSLDSIELYSDYYTDKKESVIYLGPYEVYDEQLNPVNFSLATIEKSTCCSVPAGTQVAFFLSKDNENWHSASCSGDIPSIVSFSNLNPAGSESYIDGTSSASSLTDNILENMDLDFGKEAYLNLYINSDFADKVVLQNIYLKRNLPNGQPLYGTEAGWFYKDETGEYSCAFYIESHEGRFIELGNTSAEIDGRPVTGSVFIQAGYHSFKTNRSNWKSVGQGLLTLNDLKLEDNLYPFNHKLIIEGYSYSNGFSGEKLYNGMDSYFGVLCKYVSPERFYAEGNGDLTIYTIEKFDGSIFFKVKVDPGNFSWKSEDVEIDYLLRSDQTNQLYIKILLTTSDVRFSPRVHSLKVRVL